MLLMLTRPLEPILLENSEVDLSERIEAREQALFEIRGEIRELLASDNASATDRLAAIEAIKELERQLEDTLGCLLYTSPSPRDRTRSRMPSSA